MISKSIKIRRLFVIRCPLFQLSPVPLGYSPPAASAAASHLSLIDKPASAVQGEMEELLLDSPRGNLSSSSLGQAGGFVQNETQKLGFYRNNINTIVHLKSPIQGSRIAIDFKVRILRVFILMFLMQNFHSS